MTIANKPKVNSLTGGDLDHAHSRVDPGKGAQTGLRGNKGPLFTIVTVCLNAGRQLQRTVTSVLEQEFDGFQLLIKDGGSTDASLDSLPRDPRIRIIRSPDRGIFDAMNQALDAATGRFIHFLNAGDLYVDSAVLGTLAVAIEHSGRTEFFYGDVICPGFNRDHVCYPECLSRYFLYTHMLCHQGWFVSREAYLRLGKFRLEATIGCDQVFLYDAVLGHRIPYKHVACFVVRFDIHGASSSAALQEESWAFRESSRRQYYPRWEGQLYQMIWTLRSAARALVSFPPFLWFFRGYQQCRFRGNLQR